MRTNKSFPGQFTLTTLTQKTEISPSSLSLLSDKTGHEGNFSVMKYKELHQFWICLEQGSANFFFCKGQIIQVYILDVQAIQISVTAIKLCFCSTKTAMSNKQKNGHAHVPKNFYSQKEVMNLLPPNLEFACIRCSYLQL